MSIPPYPGGRKDLVDRIAGHKRPEDFTDQDVWTRQENEREAAQHPRREQLAYWVVTAVLIVVGVAALAFMVLYFFIWAP